MSVHNSCFCGRLVTLRGVDLFNIYCFGFQLQPFTSRVQDTRSLDVGKVQVGLDAAKLLGAFDPCKSERLDDLMSRRNAIGLQPPSITSLRFPSIFFFSLGRVQEDPASGADRSAILERMAREQPPVLSMKRLRKVLNNHQNTFETYCQSLGICTHSFPN